MSRFETCFAGWITGVCEANKVDIHYVRSGGNLPPLIALHGLLGRGACLSPLARTLKDSFDVVLPDARGHGKSSALCRGYLYRDPAADGVALTEKLSLNAPVLLGHSMGGMTAALAASQVVSVLSGVILVDPTFIAPEWQREVFEGDVAEEHRQMLTLTKPDLLAQARLRSPRCSAELIDCLVDARLQTSMAAFKVLTPPRRPVCVNDRTHIAEVVMCPMWIRGSLPDSEIFHP